MLDDLLLQILVAHTRAPSSRLVRAELNFWLFFIHFFPDKLENYHTSRERLDKNRATKKTARNDKTEQETDGKRARKEYDCGIYKRYTANQKR